MSEILMCRIDIAYLNYLRQFDSRVSYNDSGTRMFVGILLEVNGQKYYAPLSSPKPKHAKISSQAADIYKIDGGKLGVINLNNMVPVPDAAIIAIDINQEPDEKYRVLLQNQMRQIRKDAARIKKKAQTLYHLILQKKVPVLSKRCCDYALLKMQCAKYSQ